ncbi:Uncharacterised protein [Streptococcus pneumoniae]|nr:Uncharacterised protein [Streptococcus pneumoniae]
MFIWDWVSIAFGWLGIFVVNIYYYGRNQRNN